MAGCNCGVTVIQVPSATSSVSGSDCIDVTGTGTVQDPFVITPAIDPNPVNTLTCGPNGLFAGSGPATIVAQGIDTNCIDITVTGDGSVGTPLTVSADPIIDPDPSNILTCGPNGLLVPSGQPGTVVAQALDTSCINTTVTGDGSAGNPLVISSVPIIDPAPNNILTCGPAGLLAPNGQPGTIVAQALDTSCINTTVTGNGSAGSPLTISADPIIDPNVLNALTCGPAGLFVDETGGGNTQIVAQALDTSCINTTVTGNGSTGSPLTISSDPIIDPAVCNALTCGPAGLLVPQVDLVGIGDPCTAPDPERSVSINVTETPGCPDVWTIRGALLPVFGESPAGASVDVASTANGSFTNLPGLSFVAPESGTYRIEADTHSLFFGIPNQVQFSAATAQRLTVNGVAVPNTPRTMYQLCWVSSDAMSLCGQQHSTLSKILTLNAGDVVQVQGGRTITVGVAPAGSITAGGNNSLLTWNKIADDCA